MKFDKQYFSNSFLKTYWQIRQITVDRYYANKLENNTGNINITFNQKEVREINHTIDLSREALICKDLFDNGYFLREIEKDGNCFINSIICGDFPGVNERIFNVLKKNVTVNNIRNDLAKELQKAIVNFNTGKWDIYSDIMHFLPFINDAVAVQNYLIDIKTPGHYYSSASNIIQYFFSYRYFIPLNIVQVDQVLPIRPGNIDTDKEVPAIFLNKLHYSSIVSTHNNYINLNNDYPLYEAIGNSTHDNEVVELLNNISIDRSLHNINKYNKKKPTQRKNQSKIQLSSTIKNSKRSNRLSK